MGSGKRQVKQGDGWRLGWNPDADQFKGLIGGDGWALELTESELDDFCRFVVQLAHTMARMAPELMAEEKISCELESDRLWLEAEGHAHAYMLHFILRTGRRGEGCWGDRAAAELTQAVQTLKLF
ncbi:MAG: DUF1818 family protein [Synechococcales bacterium]|nr:DUF1818 family protein [Synechococcales bacterium]